MPIKSSLRILALILAAATLTLGEEAPAPATVAADPLLPGKIGPLERVFWGEHGAMRYLGMPLTEENREREIHIRRGMLTAHQIGGFLTLASMTATAVTGQLILNEDGGASNDLYDRKRLLVTTTITSYFITAALAMLAPPPAIRRDQWSSISWHKALAAVHFTGIVITPILGKQLAEGEDLDTFHQISGYATLAALAGAMVVVTF